MRAILVVLLAGACGGSGKGKIRGVEETQPGVLPMLSELPQNPENRDAVLDSANQVAGPEHRKGFTKKERKAETAAALGAAILGGILSKTSNVTIGTQTKFDENTMIAPHAAKKQPKSKQADGKDGDEKKKGEGEGEAQSPDLEPQGPLVPWIKLK
jgi:hypothetical protein